MPDEASSGTGCKLDPERWLRGGRLADLEIAAVAAAVMLLYHDAFTHASNMLAKLEHDGDSDGAANWRGILKHITQLEGVRATLQ